MLPAMRLAESASNAARVARETPVRRCPIFRCSGPRASCMPAYPRRTSSMSKSVGLAMVLGLATSASLFAQATASISGRVVDEAGAVLPGANVTVTNTATGAARDTVTNGEGLYSVPALNPGTYNLRAELAGFAPQVRERVEVLTGANLAVDLKLGIAAVAETITVTGQSPLVESTQAVVASSIRQTEVTQLPMMNRSMTALIAMLPGAREVPATVSAKGHS